MEKCDYVLVRRPTEIDWWNPSATETETAHAAQPLKVLFSAPAKHWTDAAPIGNGRLGAMVWGGVPFEALQLNDDTLWTGVPSNYTDPNVPSVLPKVRELVDNGQYAEASAAAFDLTGRPPDVYQPLGDMKLDFGDSHVAYAAETYERELNLETATVKVKYVLGNVEFTREHFSSNPHQVIVTKISANKSASLSFTVSLDSKLRHHSSANSENQIIMEGTCPGKRVPPKINADENPKGIQFSAVLDLHISDDVGVIRVLDGRKLKVEGTDWAVLYLVASSSFDGPFTKPSDSTKDPTMVSLATLNSIRRMSYSELYSYHLDDYQKLFHRVSLQLSNGSDSEQREQRLAFSTNTHVKILDSDANIVTGDGFHGMEKESFSVTDVSERRINNGMISTAERVKSFKVDEDPSLVELLFNYGRYLLISCSRPGTQVANLQGIWSKDIEPAWDATPHLNINLEMNYWPSLSCNLSECQEPLFDYISSLAINGSKTAQVNYEAHGWVAHNVSDIWAKTSPHRGDPVWAFWPMGGAWICTHLWEHYIFSMDKSFLENKAYPLLEGCASFLLDWLIEGHGGYLETNPSTSPEHAFIAPDGKTASVSYSSTMDIAIIREIFSAVISAAEVKFLCFGSYFSPLKRSLVSIFGNLLILVPDVSQVFNSKCNNKNIHMSQVLGNSKSDLVDKIKMAQTKLYPTNISRDGSIMEWAQDFEDPDIHHRHLSHLFGLFPGHTITIERTPDLCKAAANSLYKRGVEGPGWSTMWKIALWAHLRNSENAYLMVKHLFNLVDPEQGIDFVGGLYSNLFAAHPPFQIDANFGFTAAIAEMLVQSTETDLYLLPALPLDKWASGCVKGLKGRGGVTICICWKNGQLHEAGLWLTSQDSVRRLHYNGTVTTAKLSSGNIYTFDRQLKVKTVHFH